MKTKKLLSKLADLLNADRRAQIENVRCIKEILKKLKKKERDLKEKLDEEDDPDKRAEIDAKLRVIYAQRTKGVGILQELRGDGCTPA
jgi:hypothetical protein